MIQEILEARGGIEPPVKVLQTFALPLGYRAPHRNRSRESDLLPCLRARILLYALQTFVTQLSALLPPLAMTTQFD